MKIPARSYSIRNTQPEEKDVSLEVWQAVRSLLVITAVLIAFGLTMLYSASYGTAGLKYFSNQLIWIGLGFAAGCTAFLAGYKKALPVEKAATELL